MQQLCNISNNFSTTANICQFAEFIAKKPHFGHWFIRSIHDEVENSTFSNRKQNVQPQQKEFAATMLATEFDTFHLIKFFKYHERCSKLFPIDDLWIIAHKFVGYPEAIFIPVRIECVIFSLPLSLSNRSSDHYLKYTHVFLVFQWAFILCCRILLKLQLNLYLFARDCNASA